MENILYATTVGVVGLIGFAISWIYLTSKKTERISGMKVINDLYSVFVEKDEQELFKRYQEKHGDIFIFSIAGMLDLVTVMDPETARLVLKNDELFPKYRVPTAKALYEFVGLNIFTASGQDWDKHKAIASSSFSFSAIQDFHPIFVESTTDLIKNFDSKNSEKFDVYPLMIDYTLDILSQTIFGFPFTGSRDRKEYIESYNELMKNYSDMTWILFPFLEKLPLAKVKKMNESLEILKEFFDEVINKHLENKKNGKRSARMSMLEIYMEYVFCDNPVLTLEELRADMFVFLIAGHETTALSLTWTLHLLSTHQEIQERLFNEVSSALQGREYPELEDLKKMPYLTRVIKESMRIEPPVLNVPTRKTTRDTPVEGTDFVIPKGSVPNIMIKALHNDPRHWKNPDKFDPERFLPENSKGRHPFSYLPFSLGRRMCIGSQFSMIEQEIALAMLVQKYKILPVDQEIKRVKGYLNVPENMFIKLEERCQKSF